jgi:hypothetical protein
VQLGAASLVMRPEHIKPSRVKPGCYALLGFVALQPFMYGQARDVDFMCRSLTLAGGLLLLIWGENDKQRNTELMGTGGMSLVEENNPGADRLQASSAARARSPPPTWHVSAPRAAPARRSPRRRR